MHRYEHGNIHSPYGWKWITTGPSQREVATTYRISSRSSGGTIATSLTLALELRRSRLADAKGSW